MEKKVMAATAMLGGMGIMGYYYMKKHPNMMCSIKTKVKNMAKKTYDKLESME